MVMYYRKVMKKILIVLVVVIVLGVAWYGVSPLFMNKKVEDALPVETVPTDSPNTETTERKPATIISNPIPITDTVAHPASGQVRLLQAGDRQILRYENYKTINGPDVRVYLATDTDAKEFIDLGPIKGTEGNINYDIPAGTDLEKYHWALTWCEDFNVLFNSADLNKR